MTTTGRTRSVSPAGVPLDAQGRDCPASAPMSGHCGAIWTRPIPGQFRDPDLHFYDLSAAIGLLVALHRVATDRPTVLAPRLADLMRHATSSDRPHAQIRELARLV